MAAKNNDSDLFIERSSSGLIARTEGLSGEPLLTQWLAHLLRQPSYQSVLLSFFVGEKTTRTALSNITIRDEERDSDGSGTPDIQIAGEKLALIVENKFDAGMTKNQPLRYMQILKRRFTEKKVLVFLVPAWRKKEIQTILAPYISKNAGVSVRICTRDELAELLMESIHGSELIHEFTRDVLRRCKVQSPLKVNELNNASEVLAKWLRQQELLKGIRERLLEEPIFKGMKFQLETMPEWDEDHCYMGINVAVSDTVSESEWVCWIGFWNLFQRKNRSATPLIAHVYDSPAAKKRLPKFWSSLRSLRAANIVAPLVHGHGWPIPIRISVIKGNKSVREQADKIVAYTVSVLSGDKQKRRETPGRTRTNS